MPARPRKIIKTEGRPLYRSKAFCALLLIGCLLCLPLAAIFLEPRMDAFSVAVAKEDGGIDVLAVDVSKGTAVLVQVVGETELELGMDRGKLRAASVWKLAESENLPRQILADTVMRSFHFPVDYWAAQGAVYNILNSETNIPLGTRLRLGMLMRTKSISEINLSETSYLASGTLADGNSGYVVTQNMPLVLASLFADHDISENSTVINVINGTGKDQYKLQEVVEILEVLGGKVAPISQRGNLTGECRVSAKDKKILRRIASVFNCETSDRVPEAFDAELELGEKFLERF